MSNKSEPTKVETQKKDDLIDQVIASCVMNQYILSKVRFDNARDTNALLTTAQESQNTLLAAVKFRTLPYIDKLLEKRLREHIDKSDGNVAIVLGNGEYVIVKASPHPGRQEKK